MNFQKKKNDLKKLVMMMNSQNKKYFPPVRQLLNTMDYVLSADELDLLLRLGTDTYSYERAVAASGRDPATFKPLFESVIEKGFTGIKYTQTGEECYSLQPIIVGWFEAQVSYLIGKPEEKEFARRWMEFMKAGRNYNFFPLRNILNMSVKKSKSPFQSVGRVHATKDARGKSVISINHKVDVPDSKIYPTNSVNDLILEYGTKSVIGQLTCMCRRVTLNINDPCRLNIPDDGGCLGLGEAIKPAIQHGYARQISREEAFDVIQKVRDQGAIHSVFYEKVNSGAPHMGICNCCWDCCGILRSYNMGSLPLRYDCFYMATIADRSKCTACKKCKKFCPTAAISVIDKKVLIDEKKCIGCGQCVHQCAFSAVELVENKRTAFLPMLKKTEARITG